MNYHRYLNSEHWFNKKKKLSSYLGGRECFVCGSKKQLHTHHKTYKRLCDEDIKKDLVFVCKKCHFAIHDLSKEKKANIWNATDMFKKKHIKKNGFRWGKKEIKDYWATYNG